MGQCAHYARCIVIRGVPQCVCPDLCPRVASPICGSDGRTYENDCAMRRESCKFAKTITLRSRGPCPGRWGSYLVGGDRVQVGGEGYLVRRRDRVQVGGGVTW